MIRDAETDEALVATLLAELARTLAKVSRQPLAETLSVDQICKEQSQCACRGAGLDVSEPNTDWKTFIKPALGFCPLSPVVWIGLVRRLSMM